MSVLVALLFAPVPLISSSMAALLTGTVACIDPRGCPDLVTDADTMRPDIRVRTFSGAHCAVLEGMAQPGTRTLLRFTFTTPNIGPGDLIVGSPALRPDLFEFSGCHQHYHFKEYADYRLWTPAAFATWDDLRIQDPGKTPAQILEENPDLHGGLITGEKRGFCIIDLQRYDSSPTAAQKYLLCDAQGISVGWADEYSKFIDGQWIDITDATPGTYVLEAEVNAERVFEEADYGNNRAWVVVDI